MPEDKRFFGYFPMVKLVAIKPDGCTDLNGHLKSENCETTKCKSDKMELVNSHEHREIKEGDDENSKSLRYLIFL